MPTPFPHHYATALAWPGEGAAAITAGPRPLIEAGAPPEFDGQEGWWSPEHLLLSSLSLCLMTTFQAFNRREKVPVHSYSCRGQATLDKTPDGLGFTYLSLEVTVVAPEEDLSRVRDLLMKAKQHCIVARALMPPVHLSIELQPAPALAEAAAG